MSKINAMIKEANNNNHHAESEIKVYTLSILEQHWYDNLLLMIEEAVSRGYIAVEWIDFLGIGTIKPNIIVEWAYKVINNQGLSHLVEPFYNNLTKRLGIILKREELEKEKYPKEKYYTLTMELQK